MKLSVLVMTYNHARYIRQALDSVLMQQCNFDWEVLVSEDCSTDGTREIVLDYQQRHPERIRLLLSEQNVASNWIVRRGIEAAKGKYIALLDGDDYWSASDKLQKQADFLDSHPDCALCFHNAETLDEDGVQPARLWTSPNHRRTSMLEDILGGNFIATCSTLFRRGLFGAVPEWYDSFFPITDWPLHILNAEHGTIGYIDETLGVYRIHSGGMYSPLSEKRKLEQTANFYRTIDRNLKGRHHRQIQQASATYFVEWAEEYLGQGKHELAKQCFRLALNGQPLNRSIGWRRLAKLVFDLYSPLGKRP